MNTTVILNPMANKGRAGRRWPSLKARLEATLGPVEMLSTAHRGHATELARRALASGTRRFIAIGGDGTANEVINGLIVDDRLTAPDVMLAHIPAGTSNELSRGLGQLSADAAFAALASGRTRAIDIFRADSLGRDGRPLTRYGFVLASLGAPATISWQAQAVPLLKRLGPFAYVITTAAVALGYKARLVEVAVDGGAPAKRPLWAAMACNFDGAGEGLMLAPGAHGVDDRQLDLVETGDLKRREALFQIIPGLKDGSYTRHAKVARRLVREVHFTSPEPIPVDVDGEALGVTPLRVRIMPWGLPVAVA